MRSRAFYLCGLLLLMFAGTSWFAASTKSPAYDEPYHAISSWLQLRYQDFRFDNEDPPLWQYWASLLNGRSALSADFDSPYWKDMHQSLSHQWYWGFQTLYRTAENNPVRFINHCRAMMLILGVLLGGLIAYWANRLGGPVAAVVATTWFCLDPNFLAHASLMKNDVAFAMSMLGLVMALWKMGQRVDLESVAWVMLLSLVTLGTKFSGFIAVLLVPVLLGIRALLPETWIVGRRSLTSRPGRILAAAMITIAVALSSCGGIWAVYGFRFHPTSKSGLELNLTEITQKIRRNVVVARYHGQPPPSALASISENDPLPIPVQAALLANSHKLLPQAFVTGFLFTYSTGIVRMAFACDQLSTVGWWWYFPFAILVKTPLATLMAVVVAGMIGSGALVRRIRETRANPASRRDGLSYWALLCLLIPPAFFLGLAMMSNLNIGIRHVLCIYPFVFVSLGIAIARVWKFRPGYRKLIYALGMMLAIESLSCFPDYIPYFNFFARNLPVSESGNTKLTLLGDSNLDWGQDLPLLASWQAAHPDQPLYLSYFGFADPVYYGIRYIPLPGGYPYDSPPHWPDPTKPAVLAISATNLQGILEPPQLRAEFYDKWKNRKPEQVLGDSIYLFRFDPMENLARPAN